MPEIDYDSLEDSDLDDLFIEIAEKVAERLRALGIEDWPADPATREPSLPLGWSLLLGQSV